MPPGLQRFAGTSREDTMRRHLAALALLCLSIGLLAACGDDDGDSSSSAAAEPASSAAPVESSAAAPASEAATSEAATSEAATSEASSEAASEPASSEAPAESSEAASSEAAPSAFGVGLELGDTLGTAEVNQLRGAVAGVEQGDVRLRGGGRPPGGVRGQPARRHGRADPDRLHALRRRRPVRRGQLQEHGGRRRSRPASSSTSTTSSSRPRPSRSRRPATRC